MQRPAARPRSDAPRSTPRPRAPRSGPTPLRAAAAGLVLTVLAWDSLSRLGLDYAVPLFRLPYALPPVALVGALVGLTRARPLLWAIAGSTAAALLVVMYTPLAGILVRGLVRRDPLRPAPVVMILSGEIHADGTFDKDYQARTLHAYTLLAEGMARRLVVSRIAQHDRSYLPELRRQLAHLRGTYPVLETGLIRSTHDEAVEVAALTRRHGWERVLLVTSPSHSRRAAATFLKAGVPVISSPCFELDYDLSDLSRPIDRCKAFRHWLREVIGYEVYRLRGWV